MSKIKIEEIYACQERNTKRSAVDAIMRLINQREAEWNHTADLQKQTYDDEVELLKAQYGELVNRLDRYISENRSMIPKYLYAAYKPFLPPPSPADRLDELAEGGSVSVEVDTVRVRKSDLHAIAAELREGEK